MSSGNKTKSQTYNTGGLYGNSTTNKNGTFYNPSSFETQLVNQTTSAIPSYLQQLVSPTYDSQSYKNLTGKMLEIKTSVDGLEVKASDLTGKYTDLKATVDGLSAEVKKDIKITDSFSLPLFAKATWNPRSEGAYFVVGLSF